jgi:hypothetical protein
MRDEQIAIVRKCVRCKRYESIDNFMPLAKVCRPCMDHHWRGGRIGNTGSRNRSIVITESGRELLRQWREEESAAPAA